METPNNNYIDQLSGDDMEFRSKMITILKNEFPVEIATYHNVLNKSDYEAIAAIVHKLKHKVSILGLEKSYYLAEEYEKELKVGSVTLQEDFEKILQQMNEFVLNLK